MKQKRKEQLDVLIQANKQEIVKNADLLEQIDERLEAKWMRQR
ncbi:Fur-regulated basic protein B [Salsuginibacillus halophilus]|uniref:Fur-regulated basic protein B n=1 Tax=Salsuginibacillus halophilus TaxID=517424 RepID=A0A2P8HYN3_9BACI|nr:FbpB family small basic protein [Salsuginibacillus halophilus]PSL51326.1 Fur-regulated basic protein B [Salsuginibacillus halophilus]